MSAREGQPRALASDEALGVIENIRKAQDLLRAQRAYNAALGFTTLNTDIALDGLEAAAKTVANAALGRKS